MSKSDVIRNHYSASRVRRWEITCSCLVWLSAAVSTVLTYKGLELSGISPISSALLTLLVGFSSCVAWTLAISQLATASKKRRALFGGLLVLVLICVAPLSTFYAAIFTAAPRAQAVNTQRQTDVFAKEVDRLISARREETQLQHYMEAKAEIFAQTAELERKFGVLSGLRGKSQLAANLQLLSDAYASAADLLAENSSLVETAYLGALQTSKKMAVAQLDSELGNDREGMKLLFGRLFLRANEHLRVLNHSEVPTALLLLTQAENSIRLMPVNSRKKRHIEQLEKAKASAVALLDSSRKQLANMMDDLNNGSRPLPLLGYQSDLSAIWTELDACWPFAIGAAVPDFLCPAIALFCVSFVRTQRRRPMRPSKRQALGLAQGKKEEHGKSQSQQAATRADDPFRRHYAS